MKNIFGLSIIAMALSACGGGGGSDGAATAVTPQPSASALAPYVGVWESPCDSRERETATFTLTPAGTLSITTKDEYFAVVGCTGPVLATLTLSASYTAVFTGTTDAAVQLAQGAAATPIKVDVVTSSVPAVSLQVAGPGVVRSTLNGKSQWCIDFGGGASTCIEDQGLQPAASARGGLYIKGNQLFSLGPNGASFVVEGIYTRK